MTLTPLAQLILARDTDGLRSYLAAHPEAIEARDEDGLTPLWLAVEQDPATLEALLTAGAGVRATDERGQTPLFCAAKDDLPEQARLLLRHGAEVGWRDASGATALHVAAEHGSPGVVAALLEAGADPNAVDAHDHTPLLNAVYGNRPVWLLGGYTRAAELLLRDGADPHYRTPDGRSIRDYAALHFDSEAALRLLAQHAG